MNERRTYADGEITIRHGILRFGSGWLPVFRVNNGRVTRAWSNAMSAEEAKFEAAKFAREIADKHVGDWAVELIDVGEVGT
jgi:hypothetical protein